MDPMLHARTDPLDPMKDERSEKAREATRSGWERVSVPLLLAKCVVAIPTQPVEGIERHVLVTLHALAAFRKAPIPPAQTAGDSKKAFPEWRMTRNNKKHGLPGHFRLTRAFTRYEPGLGPQKRALEPVREMPCYCKDRPWRSLLQAISYSENTYINSIKTSCILKKPPTCQKGP